MKRYRTDILLCGLILMAVVLVFGQLCRYGFIHFDDLDYVVENRMVGAGLTWEGFKWAFTTTLHWQWHPITWLSHMTDIEFFGMRPGMHHLVNLLFHGANSLLLFLFFRSTTGAPVRSAMVAALFALHPLHVETVAMVADRKDLLSTFFLFLGLNAWTGFSRKGGPGRYGLVFLLFVLGLMAKSVVVTLPLLLLIMDFWPLERSKNTAEGGKEPHAGDENSSVVSGKVHPLRLILEKIVLFAPMTVMAIVAILVRNPEKTLLRLPTWHHIQNGLASYVIYIGKTLWPSHLAVIYPPPGSYSLGQVVASGLVCFAITAAVLVWRKKAPWLAAGWFWYLLTLLPVIGILGYMGPHQVADRYAYVPIAGLFVMIVWGAADFVKHLGAGRAIASGMACVLFFLMMAASWLQAGCWKNSLFLFDHAVRVTRDNYEALNNLGMAYAAQGNMAHAQEKLMEALRLRPDFISARINLGVLFQQQGAFQKAEAQCREALKIVPDSATVRNNLGLVLAEQGELEEAVVHLKRAVKIAPGEGRMRYSLGNALLLKGEVTQAADHLAEAVRLQPDFSEARTALGHALALLGNSEATVSHPKAETRIDPSH